MSNSNRRHFIKLAGTGMLPAIIPFSTTFADDIINKQATPPGMPLVKLYGDGEMFEPGDYINELQKIQAAAPIEKDRYGSGGAVEALEKKFAEITGKEKAIFMPSGTMANQLAISVLGGEQTKIFVQDTSHVYRDEADATQSVFQKRLMPLAKDETYFTAAQLQKAIETLPEEEVFKSGVGAISVENPVRRADGRYVPLDEIKKISAYCRANNIKMHMDGARIYMASAWTGIPVKEYASYFDTVYISLYKYLGASGGAVLCGNKEVIDKMPHLIKIHGGSMYGNWANAAMALNRLNGIEDRLQAAIKRASELFAELNKLPEIKITALEGGTNIYNFELQKGIDSTKMQATLNKVYGVRMPRPNEQGHSQVMVNETILYQSAEYIINAFRKSIEAK